MTPIIFLFYTTAQPSACDPKGLCATQNKTSNWHKTCFSTPIKGQTPEQNITFFLWLRHLTSMLSYLIRSLPSRLSSLSHIDRAYSFQEPWFKPVDTRSCRQPNDKLWRTNHADRKSKQHWKQNLNSRRCNAAANWIKRNVFGSLSLHAFHTHLLSLLHHSSLSLLLSILP